MRTIILSILGSEEEAVTRQLYEWKSRQAVQIQSIDPLIFPGKPLTDEEWAEELKQAMDSGTVQLTKEEALALFGL